MALFNLPNRSNKEEIIEKVKKQSSTKTVSQKVAITTQKINSLLGKYKDDYLLIIKENELKDFIDKCIENGIVAIDTETMGLDPIEDDIVGISIKTPNNKAVYIPLNHITLYSRQRIDNQLSKDIVRPYIQKLVDNCALIFHEAVFDIRIFKWQLNININFNNVYWDTKVGAHVLNENEEHGLKKLYSKYISKDDDIARFSDLFNSKFNEVPIELAYIYAAHDAEMTFELYNFQYEFLNVDNINNGKYSGISYLFNYVEMPCLAPTMEMMDNGIGLDENLSNELKEKYENLLEDAKKRFYNEVEVYRDKINIYNSSNFGKLDNPINYSSPKQLGILLYDIIGIDVVDKEHPRGTGEEIITQINLPICKELLVCREYEKMLNTYVNKLPKSVSKRTGRVHCVFNSCGTVTGRYSSSNPNLQNIPSYNDDIRKMFIPKKGYCFVGSDYSQQEPRILAQLSGDEALKQAYKDGKDIYAWIASLVYKVPYEECFERNTDGTHNEIGSKRRKTIKAIVLGIIYSKSAKSIAEDLLISENEATAIFNKFFSTFTAVRDFLVNSQEFAKNNGFVETAWGRKRRLPEMQLPPYEFKYNSSSFNPLQFEDNNIVVDDDTAYNLTLKLLNAKTFYAKRSVLDEISKMGIDIIDNSYKISTASRQCVNSIIQGSAADMVKVALINLYCNEELKSLGVSLVMTIHDEIICESPIENAKRAGEILTEIMINSSKEKIEVPMKCDVEITDRWKGEEINF
ncbi:MAG: hypothetical protein GX625_18490 [Clostridiaceae bacterium]|nr:hypothetical protein [Clostridiaceae bacterium]